MKIKQLNDANPGGYSLNMSPPPGDAYTGLVIEQFGGSVGIPGQTSAANGVYLPLTGSVVNYTTAYANFGRPNISRPSIGVDMKLGGTLTNGSDNDLTAQIEGGDNLGDASGGIGVMAGGTYSSIANYGTVSGTGGVGVGVEFDGAFLPMARQDIRRRSLTGVRALPPAAPPPSPTGV